MNILKVRCMETLQTTDVTVDITNHCFLKMLQVSHNSTKCFLTSESFLKCLISLPYACYCYLISFSQVHSAGDVHN